MEKNLGLLIGGIALAGVVAFLSLSPAGSSSSKTQAPTVSNAPAAPTSTPARQVDQSTASTAVAPAGPKKSPTNIGGTQSNIGDEGFGRHHGGENEGEDD
jgi:hypothetical protein